MPDRPVALARGARASDALADAGRPPHALTLTWRQYRLERRMFWRNPSAAFFNFVLPLLFLVAGGAILHGNQHELEPARAGDRGHERDVDDLHRAGLQHRVPARARRAQAHPRRRRCRRAPTSAASPRTQSPTPRCRSRSSCSPDGSSSGSDGRPTGMRWSCSSSLGVVCFAALGVAFAHVIPNFESTAAYVNAVFLPVVFVSFFVFDSTSAPAFLRTIAEALPLNAADRRAVRRDRDGGEPEQQSRRARRDRAVGRLRAVFRRARLLLGAVA